MIPLKKLNTEAYQADPEDGITHFGSSEVDFISVAAGASPRQRCRILLHAGKDEKLHSMLVAMRAGAFVRPNRHRGKDESVTVVSGECVVVFFDGDKPDQVVRLSSVGDTNYCRIPAEVWHTLIIPTDVVLLESTPGPLDPADTEYAPWSPTEEEASGSHFYTNLLLQAILCNADPGLGSILLRTPGVWVADDRRALLGKAYGRRLREEVRRGMDRVRICAHHSPEDRLQEMLLRFGEKCHVRPSRHAEDETLYVLSGTGTYCFFDDAGCMTKQVPLGPLGSGKSCFCRVPKGRWHTLLLDGPMLVLEAASGPFKKENTEYAPWEAKK